MTTITAIPMLMTASKPPAMPRRRAVARTRVIKQAAAQPTGLDAMNESEAAALYRLMTWLSPAFPVGAFSWSSGIEWAVEAGDIVDAASLHDWLAAMLAHGPGFCDGVFLAHAHRAASSPDDAGLRDTAELAAAFAPSRERHLESSAQGRALSTSRARHGIATGLSEWSLAAMAPSSIRWRLVSSAPRMRSRWRPPCTLSFTRWRRTGYRPGRGLFPWDKPTASVCWPCWSRSWSPPPNGRCRHRSSNSAARPFAPTSPACGTKRSTRDCSGHDERPSTGRPGERRDP